MSATLRLLVGAGASLAALVTLAQPAQAGIVVLKNGEVFVGRIRADEDTADELIMRWPYKQKTERGEFKIPKFRIRWYDREADEPTDAYWEKYENEHIDNAWMPHLERWRIRKRAENDLPDVGILDGFGDSPKGRLSPIPVQTRDFEIRKPDGWTSSTEEGITIFVSDQPGADGFRPRVHVFAVPSLSKESTERQVEWYRTEIGRLGAGAGNRFEVRELKRLKPVRGGFDQELLTITGRAERTVFCLRQVSFRDKRTYFFAAYADERDFSGLEILFKACMRSLVILEDNRPQAGGPAGGAAGVPISDTRTPPLDDATAIIGGYNLTSASVNGQDVTDPRNPISLRGELKLTSSEYEISIRTQHRKLQSIEEKGTYRVVGSEIEFTAPGGETWKFTFARSGDRLHMRTRKDGDTVEYVFTRRPF